jgi:hypothetical protein
MNLVTQAMIFASEMHDGAVRKGSQGREGPDLSIGPPCRIHVPSSHSDV